MTDQSAANRWEKARVSYGYLRQFIASKSVPSDLSVLDVLLVSNFKGGNASIAEPTISLNKKLVQYSLALAGLRERYGELELINVPESDLDELVLDGEAFLQITLQEETRISGFGPSYASALLNAHLPNVFPILDRRCLSGAGIKGVEVNSQGQVKRIERYYGSLVRFFWSFLKLHPERSIENIDKELFSKRLSIEYMR